MLPVCLGCSVASWHHICVADEHGGLQRGVAARPLQQDAPLIHLQAHNIGT